MVEDDKYLQMMQIFKEHYPEVDITKKSYDVTLVRDLMMYFLYKQNETSEKKNRVTYSDIASLFDLSDHSAVIKSNKKIAQYINDITYLYSGENKLANTFKFFYYKFYKVCNNSNTIE